MTSNRPIHDARLALLADAIRTRMANGWRDRPADIQAALAALPNTQREVMTRYMAAIAEGRKPSGRAIARAMGIHHSTAQEALRAGVINLGLLLG